MKIIRRRCAKSYRFTTAHGFLGDVVGFDGTTRFPEVPLLMSMRVWRAACRG
jgi:hypothetical protein